MNANAYHKMSYYQLQKEIDACNRKIKNAKSQIKTIEVFMTAYKVNHTDWEKEMQAEKEKEEKEKTKKEKNEKEKNDETEKNENRNPQQQNSGM